MTFWKIAFATFTTTDPQARAVENAARCMCRHPFDGINLLWWLFGADFDGLKPIKRAPKKGQAYFKNGCFVWAFFLCNHYSRYHIVIFLILLLICCHPRADGRNFLFASNRPFFPQFYVVIFKKKMCLYSPAFLFNQFSFGDNIRFYSKEKKTSSQDPGVWERHKSEIIILHRKCQSAPTLCWDICLPAWHTYWAVLGQID